MLALDGDDQPTSPKVLAGKLDCSPSYLSKTLGLLTKADLPQAIRGAHGGVRLMRAPEQISLRDVFEACQGVLLGDYCREVEGPTEDCCAFNIAMLEIHTCLTGVLARWRLSDLVERPVQRKPAGVHLCKMHFGGCEGHCGWRPIDDASAPDAERQESTDP